jgi:hypothetical protein
VTVPYSAQERLVILHLGGRRLAMPLSDVALYAPATEQVAVRDNPAWMAGAVADRATGAWLPVVSLARLWNDPSLDGPWTHLVVAQCGVAIGTGGYTVMRQAVPIRPLQPGVGNPALPWGSIVDGQALGVIHVAALLLGEQREARATG